MLPPPENATASELSEVEKSTVVLGGITAVNLPHAARNFRRSSSSLSLEIVIGSSISNAEKHLHLVSDSTGETLITVARAVAAQYANGMKAHDERLFQMIELMRQRNAGHQRYIGSGWRDRSRSGSSRYVTHRPARHSALIEVQNGLHRNRPSGGEAMKRTRLLNDTPYLMIPLTF
jgi:hypothetical protein